jgi:alkane 1-monooxygenase
MRDLKYLLAYLMPISAFMALAWQGPWAWATVILAFVLLPLLELVSPAYTDNTPDAAEEERSRLPYFDWLLYLNAPILFGTVFYYLYIIENELLSTSEWLGLTFSTGIIVGTCGINVAHELGHRSTKSEQLLAKWMLLPALYQHFFIEHNRGHHKNVATDADPASAKKGDMVYFFWLRSVAGSWLSAWQLERERLQKDGRSFWGFDNEMIRFSLYQTLWLSAIFLYGSWMGLLGAIAVAVVGILLLETVNYIEHYGLRRRLLPSGRPEPVMPSHSWNSDHELGRIFLYELTRHSDHHYKSTRKYQVLRHIAPSPQMPFGYPTSILLALFPPLWFAVMNKRIPDYAAE